MIAATQNIKYLYLTEKIFPLMDDHEFGYSLKLYEGIIRGISVQALNANIEIEYDVSIKQIKQYLE